MITYIFGAGASFYSMPLVQHFPKRFELFRFFLSKVPGYDKNKDLQKYINAFEQEIRYHVSFDTFFKKLFHLRNGNADFQKIILLLFFIYEQTITAEDYLGYQAEFSLRHNIGDKRGNQDPRYEALLAGLLAPKQNRFELITKVNFITWNYDLNLVSAISNFIHPNENLCTLTAGGNKIAIHEDVNVIHLNGIVRHPDLANLKGLPRDQLLRLFEKLIFYFADSPDKLIEYAEKINFSWETLSKSGGAIKNVPYLKDAGELVSISDVVVIVGYSFPLYNRVIDSYLLNPRSIQKQQIFIQDPNEKEISSVLTNDLNLKLSIQNIATKKGSASIAGKTACDSFFVPSSLFS